MIQLAEASFHGRLAYNEEMKLKRQFSVGFLCGQVVLVCCGLRLLAAMVHAPLQTEGQLLLVPLIFTCWGAAAGGFWDNRLEGAKAGLLAGFGAFMLLMASLSSR
jgi:hypothetical protein